MLGNLIARIRKEKGIIKTELAKKTGINIGHLTHIEQGGRNPSHKVLRTIAHALGVPYQPLFSAYDKELKENQLEYHYIHYISYNKIPAISKIDGYINCPPNYANASFAYKVPDDAMSPIINATSYVFVEINGLVNDKEIGLFKVNNEYLIRKLIYKKGNFILKANDKKFKDITISESDHFQIIGKIYL